MISVALPGACGRSAPSSAASASVDGATKSRRPRSRSGRRLRHVCVLQIRSRQDAKSAELRSLALRATNVCSHSALGAGPSRYTRGGQKRVCQKRLPKRQRPQSRGFGDAIGAIHKHDLPQLGLGFLGSWRLTAGTRREHARARSLRLLCVSGTRPNGTRTTRRTAAHATPRPCAHVLTGARTTGSRTRPHRRCGLGGAVLRTARPQPP